MPSIVAGRELLGHDGCINPIAFSPDGQRFVTGGGSRIIVRSRSGHVLASAESPPPSAYGKPAVLGVAWSPDGSTIATMENHVVRLRRADTLAVLGQLEGLGIGPIAFADNGTLLVVATRRLCVRKVPTLEETTTVPIERRELGEFDVGAIASDPTSTLVATCDSGGRTEDESDHTIDRDSPQITFFDAKTGAERAVLDCDVRTSDLQFDPWRRVFYSLSYHQGTATWTADAALVGRWKPYAAREDRGYTPFAAHLAISEHYLATMPSMDTNTARTIDLWDPSSHAHLTSVALPDGERPYWIVASPDGALLVTPTKHRGHRGDTGVRLWHVTQVATKTATQVLEECASARAHLEALAQHVDYVPPDDDYVAATKQLEDLSPEEREKIVAALEGERKELALEAVKAAGQLRLESARAALERALRDPALREEAAAALSCICPADAFVAVIEAGHLPYSPIVRATMLNRYVDTHGAGALALVAKSKIDPSDDGRYAWSKLYDLDRDGCVRIFTEKICNGDIEWIEGIGKILREKGAAQHGDWARAPFHSLSRSVNPRARRVAAEVLAVIGDVDAIEPLLDAVANAAGWNGPRSRADTGAQVAAVFAVGARTKTPVAARVIAKLPPDFAPRSRLALVRALGDAVKLEWEATARDAIARWVRAAMSEPDLDVAAEAKRVADIVFAERRTTCVSCGQRVDVAPAEEPKEEPTEQTEWALDGQPIGAQPHPLQECPVCGHVAPKIAAKLPWIGQSKQAREELFALHNHAPLARRYLYVAQLYRDDDLREEGTWALRAAWADEAAGFTDVARRVHRRAGVTLESGNAASHLMLADIFRVAGEFARAKEHCRKGLASQEVRDKDLLLAELHLVEARDMSPCTVTKARSASAPILIGDEQRRAQSEDEMRFAVSLRRCPRCGARPDSPIFAVGDRRFVSGLCRFCGTSQTFSFFFAAGEGPWQVVTKEELFTELDRALADDRDRALLCIARPLEMLPQDDTARTRLLGERNRLLHADSGALADVRRVLHDAAGPPPTVGALEQALQMKLDDGYLAGNSGGVLELEATLERPLGPHVAKLSASYSVRKPITALAQLRARPLDTWTATFIDGSTERSE